MRKNTYWQETGHEFRGERGKPCELCGVDVTRAIHSKGLHDELGLQYVTAGTK